MYTIVITEKHQNVNFEAELKDYNDRGRFGGIQVPYPEKEITVKHLETSLTDEQFSAVKKAVLEAF